MTTADDVLAAARELAWTTHGNLSGGPVYRDRKALHGRLVGALERMPGTWRADGTPRGYAIAAAWRLGAATFSNRCGEPYAERREAMAQMRGALAVLDAEEAH